MKKKLEEDIKKDFKRIAKKMPNSWEEISSNFYDFFEAVIQEKKDTSKNLSFEEFCYFNDLCENLKPFDRNNPRKKYEGFNEIDIDKIILDDDFDDSDIFINNNNFDDEFYDDEYDLIRTIDNSNYDDNIQKRIPYEKNQTIDKDIEDNEIKNKINEFNNDLNNLYEKHKDIIDEIIIKKYKD